MGVAQRRARTTTLIAGALLCAACGATGQDVPEEDPSNAVGSPSTSATPASRIRPTVEPPGPRPPEDSLAGDDLLITSAEPLTDELLDRVDAIEVNGQDGVIAMERFSIGQISIESKVFDIAAVDPAGIRRFAGTDGDFQEAWDRVAGGEIVVPEKLAPRMPIGEDGYLAVGSGAGVHEIHVGALSTVEFATVDAIVNEPWGEELGLVEDNALVIHTGPISPQAVREQIRRFAPELSITDLDAVAESGIDPGTFQNVVPVGTFAEAVGVYRYTPIGGGRVQPEPGWVEEHIVTETVPLLGTLTCNRHMMPQLKAALAEVQDLGLGEEVYQTAGCYYPRFIAGSTTLSNHSFGLAIDINSLENQRGTVGQMHPTVVAVFKKWGFAWGGDWSYTDPMHFELEEIVTPG